MQVGQSGLRSASLQLVDGWFHAAVSEIHSFLNIEKSSYQDASGNTGCMYLAAQGAFRRAGADCS